MKHSLKITLLLLFLFLAAQYIGIGIVTQYVDQEKTIATGETAFTDLPIGERTEINQRTSFIPILMIVLVGTVLLLFLIKKRLTVVWKGWFFFALFFGLSVAWAPFVPKVGAFILAAAFAAWRVWRPHPVVHNFTELFLYGGMAAIFVSWFDLWSISILLILISLYDMYAVWKSKHMVTLAQSQIKERAFAGLAIPYQKKTSSLPRKKQKVSTAILGGGDIAFPLFFATVIFKELGLWQALIIPICAFLGLALLLGISKEKKFYPAMPFISLGCFLGLGIVFLVSLLL